MAFKDKNDDDHWAFLEDIEAPTWVDLAVEAAAASKCTNHYDDDDDDQWFQTSHQYASTFFNSIITLPTALKSMFSNSGNASTLTDDDLQHSSSPKLLSSVSRSRGKDYRSKKWKENCDISLNNPHPVKFLRDKLSIAGSGPNNKNIKPKLSFLNPKGTSTGNLKKPTSAGCSVENTSTSMLDKASESNKSTITSEGVRWKNQAGSSQTHGRTSGLLSAVKITLRKSYSTRPASRVEINRHSGDRKSSCSKSSVGSSSNPDHYTKGKMAASTQSKVGTTPDSVNVKKIGPAQTAAKAKVSNVLKASIVKAREGISKSRKVGISSVAKSSVSANCQNPRSKGLQSKPKQQDLPPGAGKAVGKPKEGGSNRLACGGKENATGEISSTAKHTAGVISRNQKGAKPSIPQKSDKKGLVAPKGKIIGRSEGKLLANSIHSRHFR
ncbi:hypothetical protein ACFE04_007351 [Oxalis oulophora]